MSCVNESVSSRPYDVPRSVFGARHDYRLSHSTQKGFVMFNIYGRKLPDPEEITRNLAQIEEEDTGRLRRISLRQRWSGRRRTFEFGRSSRRWWISPVFGSALLVVGFVTKDWSWQALDLLLTRLGFL